jgi:hypothetical protein
MASPENNRASLCGPGVECTDNFASVKHFSFFNCPGKKRMLPVFFISLKREGIKRPCGLSKK